MHAPGSRSGPPLQWYHLGTPTFRMPSPAHAIHLMQPDSDMNGTSGGGVGERGGMHRGTRVTKVSRCSRAQEMNLQCCDVESTASQHQGRSMYGAKLALQKHGGVWEYCGSSITVGKWAPCLLQATHQQWPSALPWKLGGCTLESGTTPARAGSVCCLCRGRTYSIVQLTVSWELQVCWRPWSSAMNCVSGCVSG